MLKNKSVINLCPIWVSNNDLFTCQVAYFPHLAQLLAPRSYLASPLQILACNWRHGCLTMKQTTLHATHLADIAPATPIHGPGLQMCVNMLNCFKDYETYIHVFNRILDLAWSKELKLTLEQQYMLSVLYSQYHACWCSGGFRSQGISRHGIDPKAIE